MSCRLESTIRARLAVRVSHLIRTLKGHMRGMTSSKCLKHDKKWETSVSALCSAQTSVGFPYSAQGLTSWNRFECKKKKLGNVCFLFFTTSIVVRTEWRASAVHTEERFGPSSGPPRPCPSGWVVWRWHWRCCPCCPLNRGGCRSCCPATS